MVRVIILLSLHDAIEDACDISEEFQQDVIMEIKENFDKEIYDAIIAMTKLNLLKRDKRGPSH